MESIPANPFKGLRPYSQDDRDKLFGRDRDLILMKDRIFSARTTLLFAGSGVGKTSFLNAKVIPALKKHCAVVWHNRWTGADETGDETEISDEPLRFWRPRALLRELMRKLRAFREGEVSQLPERRNGSKRIEDDLEAEVRKTITQNLRLSSDAQPRLSQVLNRFRKSAKDENVAAESKDPNRCILILDQFEEVFQYHAYEDYFSDFVKDLCAIINDEDYQVRVVFSMREEFLGELSIFDNRIPDLFSNYYRLRYPDRDEAEDIIRRTCQLSGVEPDEENLHSLVEDLSKIEKGCGSFAERSTNSGKASVHVIKRDFVAPPYLQIACERLWSRQYSSNENKSGSQSVNRDSPKSGSQFSPFLIDYRSGNGDASTHGHGGGAQRALREFCEEKLSSPFLSRNEQDIVARAFSFLVTKQGAKMAYELSSLADHMEERIRPLKTALEKLSRDEAKILRESRGPDRSYWFELYHDMYATIVDDWKVRYLKRRRRRNLARVAAVSMVLPGLLLFVFALFNWIINPYFDRRKLIDFKYQINGPSLEQQAEYRNAVSAFTSLESTFGYGQTARSLWADILERRAQWCEMTNDPSSALLSLLKAASMESDTAKQRRLLKTAEVLMGTAGGSLLATYCDDCVAASLSPDGKTVLTMNLDGHVRLWNADPIQPLGPPFCAYCNRSRPAARKAIFSTDGKQVLTVGGVPSCDANGDQPDDQSKTQNGLRLQVWDVATRTPLLSRPICLNDTNAPAEAVSQTGSSLGRDSVAPKPQDVPPTIDIRNFAKVGTTFWIAGVKGKEIHVWNQAGSDTPLASGRNPASIEVAFSPDGLYLFGVFFDESISLWRVPDSQVALPSKTVLGLVVGPPHQALIGDLGNVVRLVDLDSGTVLRSVTTTASAPAGAKLYSIEFSATGDQFATAMRGPTEDFVQVWRTSTAELLFQPLKLLGHARTGLVSGGRTLVVLEDGEPRVIEKWDLQTGRLLGTIKRPFDVLTFHPDRDLTLIFSDKTARLWEIDEDLGSRLLQSKNVEAYEFSPDGKILLTVSDSAYLQFWDVEKGNPLAEPIDLNAVIQQPRAPRPIPAGLPKAWISADGNYAATFTADLLLRLWQPGKQEPVATISSGFPDVLAFSTDGKFLAWATPSDFRIRTLATGNEITVKGHTAPVNDLTTTSTLALTASDDKTAVIWDLASAQSRHVLQAEDEVKAGALSSDSRLALTGLNDGTVQLWNAQSGERIGNSIKVKGPIEQIKFSGDNFRGAVLTPSWIYLVRADQNGLTYEGGMLIADPWIPRFTFLPGAAKMRFAYQFGFNNIQVLDLDLHSDTLSVFDEDPAVALDLWSRRLGLSVGDLGQIAKLWQEEVVPDETGAKSANY